MVMIPKYMFFTRGVGKHKDYLHSFELALRDAGIEKCNLVYVSSIFPPECKLISREEGIKMLKPGQITFCVMSKNSTNEPHRLISSAIGLALPIGNKSYGYISEHHAFGETEKKSEAYAEYLAATMLATTLGLTEEQIEIIEKGETYEIKSKYIKTKGICQSAIGDKDGKWTTVIAAAVFIIE
jgi:arginine decarboxylase